MADELADELKRMQEIDQQRREAGARLAKANEALRELIGDRTDEVAMLQKQLMALAETQELMAAQLSSMHRIVLALAARDAPAQRIEPH